MEDTGQEYREDTVQGTGVLRTQEDTGYSAGGGAPHCPAPDWAGHLGQGVILLQLDRETNWRGERSGRSSVH